MHLPEPLNIYMSEGKELLDQKKIGEVIFSEGTYQVEVNDEEVYWPFLQFDEHAKLLDFFCNCSFSEKHKACPHLAAAYLRIYKDEPLHVRFKKSFWNALFLMMSKRLGYATKILKKVSGDTYSAFSKTNKKLLTIEGLSPTGKKKLEEMIVKRVTETEETSLKFSNLSIEEIE